MKKYNKAFIVTLSCLLLVTGCMEENDEAVHKIVNQDSGEKLEPLRETEELIESIDDLIRSSDNIVIGVVTEEEVFGMGTYQYTFSVGNELKGKVATKSIDVYESIGDLEKGKEYFLFLESWEDELYPNPVYTSINKDSLIEVDQNALIGGDKFTGKKTKDEMIQYIKSSKEVSLFREKEYDDVVIEKANDLAHLIELSDHILHIVPKELQYENKYVKGVDVEVLQTFKGSNKIKVLMLPADVDLDKEYIVFLKGDLSYSLTTREGSVVSKDNTELWQEILDEFGK